MNTVMFKRVAIIGLGLIGGSIGLALRKTRGSREVVGYDQGRGVGQRAKNLGVIDRYGRTLKETVLDAELVILATPVGAMRQLLQELAPALAPHSVVTDVASTKVQVINWAEEFLPEYAAFIGGHPMAGKEMSGVEVADADLFKNHIYCLTPTLHTSSAAIETLTTLIEQVGARVRFLEPAEHDGQVASVSHLPFAAAVALMNTVAESASWGDASLLAANGFRDVTRLAAGSPDMYRDICLTNSTAITRSLDQYIAQLIQLREQIANHDKQLYEAFIKAQRERQNWQKNYVESSSL
jgi:prephenate dehydrogenase